MANSNWKPRLASSSDADEVGRLLDDFNREFGSPSPGRAVIASKARELLDGDDTLALLVGVPPIAVALVTLRPNVWYHGPIALLDELYVAPERRGRGVGSAIIRHLMSELVERGVELLEINVDEGDVDARRFYERHGFERIQPDTGEAAFYYSQELPVST